MFKNYFKLAFRNLWKRKAFTALNIVGLSVAFGIAILLCSGALFDLSFDQFHKNIGSIYKIYTTIQTPKGAVENQSNPVPFTPAIKSEVPGIQKISRFNGGPALVTFKDKELNMSVCKVDKDFFSIFSFPAVKGNLQNPLVNKSDVVITEKGAEKLFGTIDVVGKTLFINIDDKPQPFTVSAVLKELPLQSSFQFDMAIDFENSSFFNALKDNWTSFNHEVYVQMEEGVSIEQFQKNTVAFTNLHFKGTIDNAKRDGIQADANGQYRQMRLMPFGDHHFIQFQNGIAKVNKTRTYILTGIGLLILLIACVNFVNMSIGTSVQRLREIGMRKTLGAEKKQLFFQFWGESVLVFVLAVCLGLLISNLLTEQFKTLFRIQASLSSVATPTIIIGFIISIILVTLIAGGYPAMLLSKLGTLQSLKGKLDASSNTRLRNGLIVVQFSIAILLISGTLVLRSQLQYMQDKDLGFNKEQVIAFPMNGKKNKREALQLLRNELQNKPGVLSVTAADNILGRGKDGSAYTSALGFDHKGREVHTNMLVVDYDYIETLDIALKEGRSFNRQFGDSFSLVINEAMVKELGEKDPLHATIIMDDSIKYSIVGVVKDYHFQDLQKAIQPITMFLKTDWDVNFAYVKTAPQNLSQTMDMVKAAWKKVEPNAEFMGSFLDENIDRTLRNEKVMTTVITSGAIVAIMLSCLGLFAMSLLVVAQRTKEIGVRKVIGASVASITILLSKDFLKLVGIALLIATPIAWFAMHKWLQSYVYRIDLTAWFFMVAGLLAVLIAFATISLRTVKAALMNPVKSLRTD